MSLPRRLHTFFSHRCSFKACNLFGKVLVSLGPVQTQLDVIRWCPGSHPTTGRIPEHLQHASCISPSLIMSSQEQVSITKTTVQCTESANKYTDTEKEHLCERSFYWGSPLFTGIMKSFRLTVLLFYFYSVIFSQSPFKFYRPICKYILL